MPDRSPARFSRLILLFVAAMSCFALAAPALADTIKGRVVDPDNRPVPNATVLIVSGTRVVASAKTTSDGRYGPLDVAAGEYDVLVSAPGLKAEPKSIKVAAADAAVDVNITLGLSAVSESVVVSAAQVDTALSRSTDSVTVIDRATLDRRQTESVFDALRFVPGMGVIQSGGRGSIASIFPRGGESDYTLVLVDGIEQNAFGGGFDAAHLAAGEVERIEVVRGPESALYGDGAIGGIVQVLTRRGGPLSGQASFEGGGYGTKDGSASFSGGHQAWSFGGAVDWLDTDGDTRVFPSIGGPVSNDDYQRADGSGTIAWSDRPDRQFRFTARGGRNELGNPGPYGSDPLGLYGGLDTVSRTRNYTRDIGSSARFSGLGLQHDLQFTWANFHSKFASPFGDSEDRTRRETVRYQADLERRAVGVSAGVELLFERADNTFITDASGSPVPITRGDTGLFVEVRPALGDRAFLTAGLRGERIARRSLVGDGFGRPPFDEDVVWSANPKIGFAWFARPESAGSSSALGATKLRAHAGTGIKPPTAFDLAFTDNPDLKPERSRSYDVGVEQAFAGSAVVADATFFDNRYEDLIVSVGTQLAGASRFRTDNIANAKAHGLETGVSWHTRVGVSVRGAWTFLHTETLAVDNLPSLAPQPYKVGDPLIRRPAQQGSLEIAWASSRANLFITVNGRGDMADIEPNFGASVFTNPGYTSVNFGGSIKLVHGVELTGRVLNAGDTQYEEALGFPALGRSAMIGVRVTAGR